MSAGVGSGANYDFLLGIGFNPTHIARIEAILTDITARVNATMSAAGSKGALGIARGSIGIGTAQTQALTAATQQQVAVQKLAQNQTLQTSAAQQQAAGTQQRATQSTQAHTQALTAEKAALALAVAELKHYQSVQAQAIAANNLATARTRRQMEVIKQDYIQDQVAQTQGQLSTAKPGEQAAIANRITRLSAQEQLQAQRVEQATTNVTTAGIREQTAATNTRAAAGKVAAAQAVVDAQTQAGAVSKLGAMWADAGAKVKHAVGMIAAWGLSTMLVYGTLNTLRNTVAVINDIDYAVVSLRKVYRGSAEDIAMMADAAVSMTRELGGSITNTISAMRDWARLGYDAVGIIQLTRTALLAQNIAEMDAAEATGFLVAAINQFKLKATDAMMILDIWNEMSNRFAVTTVEVAAGVTRLGRTAADAGISIQMASAMIAVMVQNTKRSGQEIGTALRTAFTYAYRDKNLKLLQDIGIIVRRQNGELMPLMDMWTQLALKWDALSGYQQQKIAEAFGVRRITEFRTLLGTMPQVFSANRIAAESMGSALRENQTFLDSVQVKWQRLQAGFTGLVVGPAGTGALKGTLDLLIGVVDQFHKLGLGSVLAAAAFLPVLMNVKLLGIGLRLLWGVMVTGEAVIAGETIALNAMSGSMTVAATAAKALWASLGLLGQVGLVIGTVLAGYTAYKYATGGAERRLRELDTEQQNNVQAQGATQAAISGREAYLKYTGEAADSVGVLMKQYKEYDQVLRTHSTTSKEAVAAKKSQTTAATMLYNITKDNVFLLKNGMGPVLSTAESAANRFFAAMVEGAGKTRNELIKLMELSVTQAKIDESILANKLRTTIPEQVKLSNKGKRRLGFTQLGATTKEMQEDEILYAPTRTPDLLRAKNTTILEEGKKKALRALDDEEALALKHGTEKQVSAIRARRSDLQSQLTQFETSATNITLQEGALATARNKSLKDLRWPTGDQPLGEPDPLKTKAKGAAKEWRNLGLAAETAMRDIRHAIAKVDSEAVGPWYSHLVAVNQKFEDLEAKGKKASGAIFEALQQKGVPAKVAASLTKQKNMLDDMLKKLPGEKHRLFWEQFDADMAAEQGGLIAIEDARTRGIDALNEAIAEQIALTEDATEKDKLHAMQQARTLALNLKAIEAVAALKVAQVDARAGIAQSKAGPGFAGSPEAFQFGVEKLKAQVADLDEVMQKSVGFGYYGDAALQTAVDLLSLKKGGEDEIAILYKVYGGAWETRRALKQMSDERKAGTWAYAEFNAEQAGDLELIRKIRTERMADASKAPGDLGKMYSLVQDEIGARKSLLQQVSEYNLALISASGDSAQQRHIEYARRLAEVTDPGERLNYWNQLVALEQSYAEWQRNIAASEAQSKMPKEMDRTIDQINRLKKLLLEWPDITGGQGQKYFDDLHQMAMKFLEDWNQGINTMADNFASAIQTAVSEGYQGALWDMIHSMYAMLTQAWLKKVIMNSMGGAFAQMGTMQAQAAGNPTSLELAESTGVLGRSIPDLGTTKASQISDIMATYQTSISTATTNIDAGRVAIAGLEQAAKDADIALSQMADDVLKVVKDAASTTFTPSEFVGPPKVPQAGFTGAPGSAVIGSSSTAAMSEASVMVAASLGIGIQSMAKNITDGAADAWAKQMAVSTSGPATFTPSGAAPSGKATEGWPGGGKWGLPGKIGAVPGAIGLYSAYSSGDPLTGALMGYGMGLSALASLGAAAGPVGAAIGLGIGLLGKGKNKPQPQKPAQKYPDFWNPGDIMWSTTPFFEAMGIPAFAAGRYGIGLPQWKAPTQMSQFNPWTSPNAAQRSFPNGFNPPSGRIDLPPVSITLQGTGYTEIDARRMYRAYNWYLTRDIEREAAAGRRVGVT